MSYQTGVSFPVCWYPDSNKRQEPHAAIITRVEDEGVFTIMLFPARGGYRDPLKAWKENVHHIDSEYVRQNPHMVKESGCWDYADAVEARRIEAIAMLEEKRRKSRELQEELIRRQQQLDAESEYTHEEAAMVVSVWNEGERDLIRISQSARVKKAKVERILKDRELVG